MSQETYQKHQVALQNAISAIADDGLVTHYVVVANIINNDGEDEFHTMTSPGMPQWQRHGMLSYEASAQEPQPNWTVHYLHDDDDE